MKYQIDPTGAHILYNVFQLSSWRCIESTNANPTIAYDFSKVGAHYGMFNLIKMHYYVTMKILNHRGTGKSLTENWHFSPLIVTLLLILAEATAGTEIILLV